MSVAKAYLKNLDARYSAIYAKYGYKFDFANGNGIKRIEVGASAFSADEIQQVRASLRSKVLPIHQGIFDYTGDNIFLNGGRLGAKSYSAGYFVLYCSFDEYYAQLKFAVLRKIQTSIKTSVKPLLAQLISTEKIEKYFKITNESITNLHTKVEFVFAGFKDESALISLKSFTNSGLVWFEEAEAVTQRDLVVLLPTFERYVSTKFIFTYNRFLEEDPVESKKNEMIKADLALHIFSTYLDNPLVAKKAIDSAQRVKALNPKEYDHIYMGLPGGKYIAFPELSKQNNGIDDKDFNFTVSYPWYIAMDWGRRDTCAVGFYAVIDDTILVKFDEIRVNMLTPQEVGLVIKEKMANYNSASYKWAVADPSIWNFQAEGSTIAGMFEEVGVFFNKANNNREAGLLKMRRLISTKQLQVEVNKCEYFWETIPNLVMSDKKRGDIVQEGVDDHAYDETRYMVMDIMLKTPNIN